jgi:hypothetical protein
VKDSRVFKRNRRSKVTTREGEDCRVDGSRILEDECGEYMGRNKAA